MRNAESLSREQIKDFLESSQGIEFAGCGRTEKYAWVECVLGAQNYGELGKRERGVVRAYVEKMTGMSAAQMTRLIRGFSTVERCGLRRTNGTASARCTHPRISRCWRKWTGRTSG